MPGGTAPGRVAGGVSRPGQPGPRTLRTARAIVQLAAAEVLGKLGTLVIVVGAARVLPLADFGVFSVALAAGVVVAVVPSWGFDTILIQRGAVRPAELPTLLAELLALRAVVAAVVLAAVTVGVAATGAPAAEVASVACVVAACLAETLADAYRSVAVAREQQGIVARAQVVQRAVTAVLALLALAIARDLLDLAVAFLVGTLLGTVAVAVGSARLGVRPNWRRVNWRGLGRLLRESWSAGAHSVASMALFRADALLLAALAGAAAAGQYAAAYRLLETVIFVCWTVARAVFPVMVSATDRALVRRGADRGLVVLAAVFLPYAALLWCRGGDILRLLYGASFARDSGTALVWLAPAPLVFGGAWLAAYVLQSDGPNPVLLIGSTGALAVNLGLNLALIPRFGPSGSAAATSISYAVELALLYPPARARVGPPKLARPLLPALAGATVLAGTLLL
ncbi:MAG TPA: oligosaccharide flippase family protein, partial [Mycobacteriales bacterium]|nr:oligosaccharide flippase family protein [Mycobacteriales bacterium]